MTQNYAPTVAMILLLFGALAGCASSDRARQERIDALIATTGRPAPPNILFIFADDWGFGDLGCHGHEHFKTPHLDRLASEGTDFHQFTVSNPVCSPSRTAMLTGHYPARYNINRHFATIKHHVNTNMPDWLDPEAPMLPRILQHAGYKTYHFGKWHLTNRDITDAPLPTAYGYDKAKVFNGPGPKATHDGLFDDAIDVINNAGEAPFFINLWVHETHTPHYPKPEYLEQYKHLSEQDRVYAAVVTNADHQIGRVLKALEDKGLADNTLVIFSSDNGPEGTGKANRKHNNDPATGPGLGTYYSTGSSGGLRGRKRSLYEGGVRVPLIVRWPGKVEAGYVNNNIVLTGVDWLPTLSRIAGASLPAGYTPDGEDRSAVLLTERLSLIERLDPPKRTKPIYWLWPGNHNGNNWPEAAIRVGKWKLVIGDDGKTNQLYDIPNDRAEANDLANENPDVVANLRPMLDAWLESLPEKPNPKCFSKMRGK